jgi:hypothetical protein
VAMPDPSENKANVKNKTQYDKQKWALIANSCCFVCLFFVWLAC